MRAHAPKYLPPYVVVAGGVGPFVPQVFRTSLLDYHVYHSDLLHGQGEIESADFRKPAAVVPLPCVVGSVTRVFHPCSVVLLDCCSGHPLLYHGVAHVG